MKKMHVSVIVFTLICYTSFSQIKTITAHKFEKFNFETKETTSKDVQVDIIIDENISAGWKIYINCRNCLEEEIFTFKSTIQEPKTGEVVYKRYMVNSLIYDNISVYKDIIYVAIKNSKDFYMLSKLDAPASVK